MVKQIFITTLLIVIQVSCTPINQQEPVLAASPSITPYSTATAQFMRRLSLLQTPSTSINEPMLVFFVSEQGRFEAWMPVSGGINEFTTPRTFFGKPIECSITYFSLNSASAMVQYCDLASEDIALHSENAILEEARNAIEKDSHLKTHKEQTELVVSPYPELLFSGEEDMRGLGYDGIFKARIILVEKRIYLVLMSVHLDNWCNCLDQIDQVVDSFYIDSAISIPFEPTP